MLMFIGPRLIQFQLVVVDSTPWSRNKNKGIRLIKNESLTAVLTWVDAQLWLTDSCGAVMDINKG